MQLLVKTRASRFAELEAWLAEHHPYEVPEILAIPIAGGARSYLDWLEAQTAPEPIH